MSGTHQSVETVLWRPVQVQVQVQNWAFPVWGILVAVEHRQVSQETSAVVARRWCSATP